MPKALTVEQALNFYANTTHWILQGKGGCGKSLKATATPLQP